MTSLLQVDWRDAGKEGCRGCSASHRTVEDPAHFARSGDVAAHLEIVPKRVESGGGSLSSDTATVYAGDLDTKVIAVTAATGQAQATVNVESASFSATCIAGLGRPEGVGVTPGWDVPHHMGRWNGYAKRSDKVRLTNLAMRT